MKTSYSVAFVYTKSILDSYFLFIILYFGKLQYFGNTSKRNYYESKLIKIILFFFRFSCMLLKLYSLLNKYYFVYIENFKQVFLLRIIRPNCFQNLSKSTTKKIVKRALKPEEF